MTTTIYYFSETGNSFAVARDISQRINAKLISIPDIIDMNEIHVHSDCIGIVFPSYLAPIAGAPLIIERFVKRLSNIKSVNVFAVCTCGGYECVNALPSLVKLRRIIKGYGGRLSAEYSVRLPMNNLDYDHIPIPINKDTKEIIKKSNIKISNISTRIIKGKGTKYRIVKNLFYYMMKPLYLLDA